MIDDDDEDDFDYFFAEKKIDDIISKRVDIIGSKRYTAGLLAKAFDNYIRDFKVKPTIDGMFIFTIRLADLLNFTTMKNITRSLRNNLKNYGYTLRKIGNLVEVIKNT